MNLFIIRFYYEIAAEGVQHLSIAYMIMQRVADQYRFITRSDIIPAIIRERVRLEVIAKTRGRVLMGA